MPGPRRAGASPTGIAGCSWKRGWTRSSPSPSSSAECEHVYNQFVVRVPASSRDGLRAHLITRKIGTEIYYPIPLHLQPCFAALGHKPGDFPASEAAARETIALPMYPELSDAMLQHVVGSIGEFVEGQAILPIERKRNVA